MVDGDEGRPLWVWENGGGSRGAPKRDPNAPRRRPRSPPQDTPEGCVAMAVADMAEVQAPNI